MHHNSSLDFHESINNDIEQRLTKTDTIMQMQVFSSAMNENLINDLLDMAKMQNNKFVIHKDYFNFGLTIKNSLHIIH